MSDFTGEILNIGNYKYRKVIKVTNSSANAILNTPVKLNLDESDFNFSMVQSKGRDIRFALSGNGTGVLHSWISFWDAEGKRATLWFKLPNIAASETITVYVFFGFELDVGLSTNMDEMGFKFACDFTQHTHLSTTSFAGSSINPTFVPQGGVHLGISSNFLKPTSDSALVGLRSWVIDTGVVQYRLASSGHQNTYFSTKWTVSGTNLIDYYSPINNRTFYTYTYDVFFYLSGTANVRQRLDTANYTDTLGDVDPDPTHGLEPGYTNVFLAYNEENDTFYYGMKNRTAFSEYEVPIERKHPRNVEISTFRVAGYQSGGTLGYLIYKWIVVYDYTLVSKLSVDYSDLYIPYEFIPQTQDNIEYSGNLIIPENYHFASYGDDPYKLSDGLFGVDGTFIVDSLNTDIVIDVGRSSEHLVSSEYLHFSNSNIGYYSAAKLSDSDESEYSYWKANLSSTVFFEGQSISDKTYAAIKFPVPQMIGSLSLRALESNIGGMIGYFNFYGSNIDPRFAREGGTFISNSTDLINLYYGKFQKAAGWQTVRFSNKQKFMYYILEALSTYGGQINVREWGMSSYNELYKRSIFAQLRLRPLLEEDGQWYFPKIISLFGSDNGIDWIELMPRTYTFTPFVYTNYGYWQRYSFVNHEPFYMFKLRCEGNWGAPQDKIKIAEIEIVEKKIPDDNFYFNIPGVSRNVTSIWTSSDTIFDHGSVFFNTSLALFAEIQDDVLWGYREIPFQSVHELLVMDSTSDFNPKLVLPHRSLNASIVGIMKTQTDLLADITGLEEIDDFVFSGDWYEQGDTIYGDDWGETPCDDDELAWRSKDGLTYGQTSTLTTTAYTSGTLSFMWLISSGSASYIFVSKNGSGVYNISWSTSGWRTRSFSVEVGDVIEWKYQQGTVLSGYPNAGFVECIKIT